MIFRNEKFRLEATQPENLEGKEKGKEVLRTIPKKIEGGKGYQKINVSYYIFFDSRTFLFFDNLIFVSFR
jgi:hypothetical protein